MIISIESDNPEMSFLLHKHPAAVHTDTTTFGTVHVFYPNPQKVVLLLEIDPLRLTRRGGVDAFALEPYVNDRTYVANSFLSVAINQVFRTAIAGRCNKRPDLVDQAMNFKVILPALPCRSGVKLLRSLFEPLGYEVEARRLLTDEHFPEWGGSAYYHTHLSGSTTLSKLLRHLYLLIPVLDNQKHYWVGKDEIDKLLDKGGMWLSDHPQSELIVNRYLKHQRGLAKAAIEALSADEEETEDAPDEESTEKKIGLHGLRLDTVVETLRMAGVTTVADLGCGEGKLVRRLLKQPQFSRIVAMDVSVEALEKAERSLDRVHEKIRSRVELIQSSLTYDDERLHNLEAACLVEVIEHLEPERLERVAHNLLHRIRPRTLIVTTPNREYNVLWESLPAGKFRHSDHRFEWTRAEFEEWAQNVKHDYQVTFYGLGEEHPEFGCPSQMAVFTSVGSQ